MTTLLPSLYDVLPWSAFVSTEPVFDVVSSPPSAGPAVRSAAPVVEALPAVAPAAGPSASSEWDAKIAAKVQAGMNHSRARSAVARENPQLRERLVAEANPAPKSAVAVGPSALSREWNAKIASKVQAGMNRQRAVKAVARENPQLRERLVAEANR